MAESQVLPFRGVLALPVSHEEGFHVCSHLSTQGSSLLAPFQTILVKFAICQGFIHQMTMDFASSSLSNGDVATAD